MICSLCLIDNHSTKLIDIFSDYGKVNVAAVLSKHFYWFKLKTDDTVFTKICDSCWTKVWDFHEFYNSVEQAHNCVLISLGSLEKASETSQLDIIKKEPIEDSNESEEKNMTIDVEASNMVKTFSSEDEFVIIKNELSLDEGSIEAVSQYTEEDIDEFKKTNDEEEASKTSDVVFRVNKHTQSVEGVSPAVTGVQCDICGYWCKTKKNLYGHKRGHNLEGESHVCNVCGQTAPNRNALLSHQSYMHSIKYKCSICKKAFKKLTYLKEHTAFDHSGESMYKCAHCSKAYKTNYGRFDHMRVHHPKEYEDARMQRLENFKRPEKIPKTTSSIDDINSRNEIFNIKNEEPSGEEMETTMVSTNSENNKNTFQAINDTNFIEKTKDETSNCETRVIPRFRVQCDICCKWYTSLNDLRNHKHRHYIKTESHVCNICGEAWPNRLAWRDHQRNVHYLKFECNKCSKAFGKLSLLKVHIAADHTGGSLHSCDYCPKVCNSRSGIRHHMMKFHPKEFETARQKRLESLSTVEDSNATSEVLLTKTDEDGQTHNFIIKTEDPDGYDSNIE